MEGYVVESFLPLVGAIARTVSRGLPSVVEIDELINDGVLGLYTALERYDPRRNVGFSTYAGHRIRGAMLDGLRRRDPLPRALRRAQKAFGGGGIQFHDLDEALMVPADEDASPEALVLEADLRRRVRCGLEALPPRDREVLELRMVRGWPLRAVAEQLSLSITRVAEIQARGLERLRRYLEGEPMLRPRRGSAAGNLSRCQPAGLREVGCRAARPPGTPASGRPPLAPVATAAD